MVKYQTDADAIRLANDCPFGLGSTVFSGSKSRANAIAHQLQVNIPSSSLRGGHCQQFLTVVSGDFMDVTQMSDWPFLCGQAYTCGCLLAMVFVCI